MNAGDEIIAIDDYRVLPDELDKRLQMYRPGQKVTLTVTRLEELKRLPVTLGSPTEDRWMLEVRATAMPEQRTHFTSWLR